jgi:negative regulator of flagellin synthesis FlgM
MQITSSHASLAPVRAAATPVRARVESQPDSAPGRRTDDTVEVSAMANALSKQTQPGTRVSATGIRSGLVERVRREIAAGTYDTPEKLDVALDRMIDELL